jgi:hypothetical protein
MDEGYPQYIHTFLCLDFIFCEVNLLFPPRVQRLDAKHVHHA